MTGKHKIGIAAAALATGIFVTSPLLPIVTGGFASTGMAQAQGLDGFFKKVGKDLGLSKNKSKKRKGSNNDLGLTILQGVGLGLVAGGIIKGKAGPLVVGSILMAAPAIVKADMERKYGRDQSWAGCVSCNKKRLLVRPGTSVTSAQQAEIEARIKNDVRDIQGALATLGYYNKKIDGDYGPGSRQAAALFQKSLYDEPTGKLTAEQRRELFVQAQAKGYMPQYDVAKAAIVPATPAFGGTLVALSAEVGEPTIKEYKLAESQFGQFTSEVLKKGELTTVKDARLLGDGRIEVALEDGSVARSTVQAISVRTHDLSDSWIQVSMRDGKGGEELVLNTVDTFSSATEASEWSAGAQKRLVLLEKLTESEEPAQTPVIVVDDTPSGGGTMNAAEAPVEVASAGGSTSSSGKQAQAPVQKVADGGPMECGHDVYVSFNFPEGDSPVNHYNITPPEGTLMMDNGDTTAYFTGSCVQGTYDYKYVVVTHDEKAKSWGSFEREGSFELASLSGQCEVNLNDPNGSATLQCF